MGSAAALLEKAGIPQSGKVDAGLLLYDAGQTDVAVPALIEALEKHRHFERETDPPRV
jgi:catalase